MPDQVDEQAQEDRTKKALTSRYSEQKTELTEQELWEWNQQKLNKQKETEEDKNY